jgi:predicted O-methyltransferase YrrM
MLIRNGRGPPLDSLALDAAPDCLASARLPVPLLRRHPPVPRLLLQDEAGQASPRGACTLEDLVSRAQADQAFNRVSEAVRAIAVESWLTDRERALLFAIGAYAPGEGMIAEIGSWKGASACFIAGGIARRRRGRLTCVDPHAGGPPWLGLAPSRSTLESFRATTRSVGVAELLDARVGDSFAVSASWPGVPLDAVLIDGDHSLIGALKDFECWAPKVRPGGVVLLDDADEPALPDLLALLEELKQIEGVSWLGMIDGMAGFRREAGDPWDMLEALRDRMSRRGVHRSRDMSELLEMKLPANFMRSREWEDAALDTAYELCFLARCGPGPYAYSPLSGTGDRALLHALSADRRDGEVIEVSEARACRVLVCRPEEVQQYATALQAGGVVVTRDDGEEQAQPAVHQLLIRAGFDGCGWLGPVHWGIRQPHVLSPDAVLDRAIAALAEPQDAGSVAAQATVTS